MVTVTAGADGAFAATVPSPFGTSVITVAVTTRAGATGYARRTVVVRLHHGHDRARRDRPGRRRQRARHVRLPDLGRLPRRRLRHRAVPGDRLRRRRRAARADPRPVADVRLTPRARSCSTSSCTHPDATTTSTAPPFASRNYTIADVVGLEPSDRGAGLRQPGVRGRRRPVAGPGVGAGQPDLRATSRCSCRSAALGTPGPGWSFTVVLHGQDGFSPDQARGFQPTPQPFQFGLCASADVVSPICGCDPAAAPKAMDVITPAGVDQSVELDPTLGPVRIAGVPVP